MRRIFVLCAALLVAACAGERHYSLEEPPPGPDRMPWESPHAGPAATPSQHAQATAVHALPNVGSAGPLKTAMVGGYMDAQERDFRMHLRGAGIARIGDDIVISLRNDVLFEGTELSSGGREVTERLAELLRHYDHSAVQVSGFTDTTGTTDQNLVVSQKRARLVADALVSDGVAGSRVSSQGFGASRLKIATGPDKSEPRNRRIEIRVIARPVG